MESNKLNLKLIMYIYFYYTMLFILFQLYKKKAPLNEAFFCVKLILFY